MPERRPNVAFSQHVIQLAPGLPLRQPGYKTVAVVSSIHLLRTSFSQRLTGASDFPPANDHCAVTESAEPTTLIAISSSHTTAATYSNSAGSTCLKSVWVIRRHDAIGGVRANKAEENRRSPRRFTGTGLGHLGQSRLVASLVRVLHYCLISRDPRGNHPRVGVSTVTD